MIGTWLEEIKSILRPELNSLEEALKASAGDEEIEQVEATIGVSFPDDLKELYHIHNGESRSGPGFFFGLQFLSLEEMVSEWKIWSELEPEYQTMGDHYSIPSGWIKEQYINRHWIPFCHDGGGNHLGIDLSPAEHGVVGQVINFGRDEEMKYVIARSLGEFIHFMRDTVRHGNYTIEEDDGFKYWMYGRNEQSRMLKDAQAYALADLPKANTPANESEVPLNEWFEQLDDSWRERIITKSNTVEEFVGAHQIFLIREQLTDITPLERCHEVRELILSVNDIQDIRPLANCRELKKLYLVRNPIRDLTPLRGLPYLQIVNLEGTLIEDLDPLTTLPHLCNLDCTDTRIQDYTPLAQMSQLTTLALSSPSRQAVQALSSISGLRELKVCSPSEWTAEDWQHISESLSLRKLHIEDAYFADMSCLQACDQLETLTIHDTRISDISAIADLPNLNQLELNSGCQISNIETISKSVSLEQFIGSFAQFQLLKDTFAQYVKFHKIVGEMTDEEEEIWHSHIR